MNFFEMSVSKYVISFYQSPSQSSNKYVPLIKTFEQLLVHDNSFKSYLLLITDNFNARSLSWWSGNVNNIEDTQLISITSFYGLHQISDEVNHIVFLHRFDFY